jgi:transcriptional regulator with XRE-family HTH domain
MSFKELLEIENINTVEKAGNSLKRFRKIKKLSQTDLAKMMNMRQSTVSDVERGKGNLLSFIRIIQALKLNFKLSLEETTNKKVKFKKNESLNKKNKLKKVLSYLENVD